MFKKSYVTTDSQVESVLSSVQLSVKTFSHNLIDRILNEVAEESTKWENSLKNVLSDPLAKRYWHKRRPRHTVRLFPYLNTGKLMNSIIVKNDFTQFEDNFAVYLQIEINSRGAYFTNLGLRRRKRHGKSGRNPSVAKWKGWVDDVFDKNGRGRVKSIRNVIEDIMRGEV